MIVVAAIKLLRCLWGGNEYTVWAIQSDVECVGGVCPSGVPIIPPPEAAMRQIVLDDEQARTLAEAQSVELLDRRGNHLGYVDRDFTAEDIAIARRRSAARGPCSTTEQMIERLKSLGRP